jgi:hypothetical protein
MLLVIAFLFVIVASSLPEVGGRGPARIAAAAGLHVGVGGLLLVVAAAVLPLASVNERRRGLPGGLGPFGVHGGALGAHGLVLIVAAILLGLLSFALLVLRYGQPDRRGTPPVLRRVLDQGPPSPFVLAVAEREVAMTLDFDNLPADWPRVRLRLHPRWRVLPGQEDLIAGTLAYRVHLRHRVGGAGRWSSQTVDFARGGARQIEIAIPPPGRAGTLELRLAKGEGGYALSFGPGSVMLLGPRASTVTSLMKSFLLLGLAAVAVLALAMWLSGFVAYPIAAAGALTAALASALVASWLPGIPLIDPGALLRGGLGVGWEDLGSSALKALLWVSAVVLLPLRDPRLEGPR